MQVEIFDLPVVLLLLSLFLFCVCFVCDFVLFVCYLIFCVLLVYNVVKFFCVLFRIFFLSTVIFVFSLFILF